MFDYLQNINFIVLDFKKFNFACLQLFQTIITIIISLSGYLFIAFFINFLFMKSYNLNNFEKVSDLTGLRSWPVNRTSFLSRYC